MSDSLRMVFEPLPSADLRDFIEDNVVAYNFAQTGVSEWHPLGYFLRDELGEWMGGCLGYVWGGWIHIQWLWVTQPLRGQGEGGRLLQAAEAFGLTRGARAATLETHSFQALRFYQNRGYAIAGTLEDFPPGHSKYFLRKTLSGTPH